MSIITNHPTQSKVKYAVRVGDHRDRLALDHAKLRGYRITLIGDGYAEITNPKGRAYYVSGFHCTCPDAQEHDGGTYGGRCKHVYWTAQLHTCDCGGTAELTHRETPTGVHTFAFECPVCGTVKSVDRVRKERAEWQEETRRLAEQRQRAEVIEQGKAASELVYG